MRKLKIIEHISLDGVIQAPGGPKEIAFRSFVLHHSLRNCCNIAITLIDLWSAATPPVGKPSPADFVGTTHA